MKRLLIAALVLALSACTALQASRHLSVSGNTVTFTNVDDHPDRAVVVTITGPSHITPPDGVTCDPTREAVTACHLHDVPVGAHVELQGDAPASLVSSTWRNPDGILGQDVSPR